MRRLGGAAAAAGLLVLLTGCGSQAAVPTCSPTLTVAPTSSAVPMTSPSTTPTAAAATPVGSPAPSPASAVDDPGRPADQCPDDALGVAIVRAADRGGAGSTSFEVLIMNTGGDVCSLRGAPGVAVADSLRGPRVGPAAARDQDGAAVSLKAGGTAVALLRITGIGADGGPLDGCTVRGGAGYRVLPPHGDRAVFVVDPSAVACEDGPVFMTVGPVLAQ